MKVSSLKSIGISLLFASSSTAFATENASTLYPIGVDTVLNAIRPAPGTTQFYSYTQYYVANKFAGAHGESAIPNFSLSAFVEAPRFLHTWESLLGPFTMTTGAVLPIVHASNTVGNLSGNHGGIGDLIIHPLTLGYASQAHDFFAYVSADVALRTGSYSASRLVNTGTNTYGVLPMLSMTWFPRQGLELSMTSLAEFRSKNNATNYQSGNVSITDFNIGYSISPKMQLSLQGYFLKQFSDDKQNGVRVGSDGFRGQVLGLGPQLRYDLTPKSGFVLKYQREMAVRNRPQGDRLWAEFTFPLE